MRRLVAVAFLVLGLTAVPGVASAAPIGISGCAQGALFYECDIYADYTAIGASLLGISAGNLGGYLPGYTFLLNQGADLTDGFNLGDVAHILVIHDSLFELFSNTAFSTSFAAAFAAAGTGADIDGVSPSLGQLAGCPPIPSGVPNLGGVGYCATSAVVTLFPDFAGGNDLLRIHTALPPPPPPTSVPEPSTFPLLLGGAGIFATALRRRRARKLE